MASDMKQEETHSLPERCSILLRSLEEVMLPFRMIPDS
jgi:hypothetical protein